MQPETWKRLSPLLDALLDLEPARRREEVEALCRQHPEHADTLRQMVELDEAHPEFLSQPLLAPPPGPRPGLQVGPYRLERLLGEGGMGQVWLAARADGLYQRQVALKLLRPGLVSNELRQHFHQERQILARLMHPNIASLLDAGISSDGQPYLALERVDGQPITDWCRAHVADVPERLRLFVQVCAAVSHAHANLVVHRDIKPSNILVTPDGTARLLDFGIAKLLDGPAAGTIDTRTGLRAFTLHYAAPEQLLGEPVTTMTDVYALGMVLHELLSDSRAYALPRQSDAQWEDAILHLDPRRPSQAVLEQIDAGTDPDVRARLRRRARSLVGDLDNIVLKALAKVPEQRYPSAEALALDLQRYLTGEPVLARRQSIPYRLRKFVRRNRWPLATTTAIVVVSAIALGIVAWQAQRALQAIVRAQALRQFMISVFDQAGSATRQDLEVRDLLQLGVQRSEHELADQPLVQAELFGLIARLQLGLGDYRPAATLAQRQRALLARTADAPPGLRLQASTTAALAYAELGETATCIRILTDDSALAGQLASVDPVAAADFHRAFGHCRGLQGPAAVAREQLQLALALYERADHAVGRVQTLAELADLDGRRDPAAGVRGYRHALSVLQAELGDRHPLAIDLQRTLCALQRSAGHPRQAEPSCQKALQLALALRGPDRRETIDAQRQLAALHVDQGRFREAESAFRHSREWLSQRLGERHPSVARDDNSLGIIAWEQGRTDVALRDLDRAIATLREVGIAGQLRDVQYNRAMVLQAEGRSAQALPELQALQQREQQADPASLSSARILFKLGETEWSLGQRQRGLVHLQQADAQMAQLLPAQHPQRLRTGLALAAAQAESGDAAGTHALQQLARLPAGDPEQQKLAWLARAHLARQACLGSQPAQGRQERLQLRTQMADAFPEGGGTVRSVERLTAACD